MRRDHDPEFQTWIARARAVSIADVASRLNLNLRRAGGEWVGSCPACGGTDRFAINPTKDGGVFNCRGSDAGGNVISMVMHTQQVEFVPACEIILGEPPPQSESRAVPRPIDHDREREMRDIDRDRALLSEREDAEARRQKARRAIQIFNAAQDIAGTQGDEYYQLRGIKLAEEQRQYLRFVRARPYYDGVDKNGDPIQIGEWPAIVALMRDADGNGIGLHCTYLDQIKPTKIDIWLPDEQGRQYRLNARKMYGTKGLIWLSKPRAMMAVGEGMETSISWYEIHTQYEDIAIAAAGDLGNLCGGATGSRPHPRILNRTIPNGEPDPAAPGFPVPPAVKELFLLGDADPDEANVRAHLLTAMRRHERAGLKVFVHMSPHADDPTKKFDWNDERLFILHRKSRRGE